MVDDRLEPPRSLQKVVDDRLCPPVPWTTVPPGLERLAQEAGPGQLGRVRFDAEAPLASLEPAQLQRYGSRRAGFVVRGRAGFLTEDLARSYVRVSVVRLMDGR